MGRGLVGLQNLGNTCFMASTLQCLSNIPRFREYFSSGVYLKEINRQNPLGQEGKLAEAFGDLLRLMWPSSDGDMVSVVAPRGFKYQMGVFRPEFQGYQQHDSSELMNFLLDGLHEDLNRVPEPKPYVETVEREGPDEEVAQFRLSQYRRRNDSQVHDLFLGQFKSTLVCPVCGNISITFDPYNMVSLPLRTHSEEMLTMYSVKFWRKPTPQGPRECSMLRVGVPKGSKVAKVRQAIAEQAELDPNQVVLATVRNGYCYNIHEDAGSCEYNASSQTFFAFEVANAAVFQRYLRPTAVSELSAVTVYMKHPNSPKAPLSYSAAAAQKPSPDPILFNHPRSTTMNEIYQAVASQISPDMDPSAIEIYVADDRAYRVEKTGGVIPNNRDPVKGGLEERLGLVVTFVDPKSLVTTAIPGLEPEESGANGGASGSARGNTLSINDCFDLFSTPEKLSPEDSWYCPKCKNHVEANKTMQLWSAPEVLVLHLKRFSYSRFFRNKIGKAVSFPLEGLDLSPYVVGPQSTGAQPGGAAAEDASERPPLLYDCVAVSEHMGSLGGGHYTASAKSCEDGKWYKFNDASVREVTGSSVNQSGDAYLLFYVRRDAQEEAPQGETKVEKEEEEED